MKGRFAIILLVCLLGGVCLSLPTHVNAYTVKEDGNGHALHWTDSRLPVSYKINVQGTPDTSGEFAAIQLAFKTWEDVLPAKISFPGG